MTIKVITFDLDDTLWAVEPALRRAEAKQNEWLRSHRPQTLRLDDDALRALRIRVWRDSEPIAHNVSALRKRFLRAVQREAGYSAELADAGAEGAFQAFLQERQRVDLFAGIVEMLEALSPRYRLGALTNGNADVYKTDAGRFFDFAFLAEDIGASKPAPEMFHAALEHTGASPEETLHVGDSPDHDVRGAKAVGMRTVWVNAQGNPWEGDDHPDAQTRHVCDLPAILRRFETVGA